MNSMTCNYLLIIYGGKELKETLILCTRKFYKVTKKKKLRSRHVVKPWEEREQS